ncbi:hypothetical protein Tco_0473215, partial [Tanacetum coccineum]
KRKLDNNNQAQQQILKRQNVVQAYPVGSREKKPSDCPVLKNQGTEARGMVYALGGGETNQDLGNTENDISA